MNGVVNRRQNGNGEGGADGQVEEEEGPKDYTSVLRELLDLYG